jgi:hypothetical protein
MLNFLLRLKLLEMILTEVQRPKCAGHGCLLYTCQGYFTTQIAGPNHVQEHPQTRNSIVLTSRNAKPAGSHWKLTATMLYRPAHLGV